ncbi:Rieske iron-sulfur protein SoxL2 [Saccharolobus caldissimus]|uniref:Rieske iron-sulfur protein SoxL2 n=1 Tax=Saccharolobus caldissimus TaxID=1702097 RepID=A0AAQ4CSD8_9CREN|nr:Rieske iron-sulfur protein SoxL2 [Saccharolobus caldissimus]BDB98719.1 Rieske iron-sulfur protein SoxL2 [Saccharolobus caldissimus]
MIKFKLGKDDKTILDYSDLAFIRKLTKKMRDPKTRFDPREFVSKGEDYLFNYTNKNVGSVDEKRRRFLKSLIFGIAAAAVVGIIPGVRVLVPPTVTVTSGFPKSLLVDSSGNPIKASSLPVNSPYIVIFEYPMTGEPNFLINLGDASGKPVEIPPTKVVVPQTGKTYDFPGGVGPYKSIVAYSAICQHLGCTPPYIHFYPPQYVGPAQLSAPEPDQLSAQALLAAKQAKVPALIHCDCHGSTYDPYHGAAVLTGPTVRPLPAVVLEWDSSTDYLYAIGAVGVATYPNGSNGIPSTNPTDDLSSSFGSPVGNKTVVSETENPFSS